MCRTIAQHPDDSDSHPHDSDSQMTAILTPMTATLTPMTANLRALICPIGYVDSDRGMSLQVNQRFHDQGRELLIATLPATATHKWTARASTRLVECTLRGLTVECVCELRVNCVCSV